MSTLSLKQLTLEQRTRLRIVAVVGVLITLFPLCHLFRLEGMSSLWFLETDESRYYLPTQEFLVPMSLGYREAAAGVIWTQGIVYFGEQHEVRGDFRHLESYLVAVTTLDPYFYRAYTWGSVAAIYNGTLIDRNAVEMSIRMLERGLTFYPDDGTLHYYLGFQYYFELRPLVATEEREQVTRAGMDELCTAALLGGGPPFLPLLCSNIAERQGMEHLAQERLLQTLVETEDPRTRTRIEERLEDLMTPDVAFRAMRRIDEYRANWEREMPYAPPGLFVLVGEPGVFPLEHQLDLPLPMDAIIRAGEEDLLYRSEPEPEVEPLPHLLEEGSDEPDVEREEPVES